MISGLDKKGANIEKIAEKAVSHKEQITELLETVTAKKETIRENSSKTLNYLSEHHPLVLYPKHWDFFVNLLESKNIYHKLTAICIIANLVKSDKEKRFEKIFDKYYSLLDDKSMICAAWTAGQSAKIVKAKLVLEPKITKELLDIDKTHHDPERIDLIKAYIIESFSEYFEETEDREKIFYFVKKQLDSKSPKTRKNAKKFLKKWGADYDQDNKEDKRGE